MRFIVISDIHADSDAQGWINEKIAQHDADAVLVLGDITHFGPLSWAEEFLKGLDAPAYAIPGNCDPLDLPETVAKVATDMHGKSVDLNGLTLVGLGGSNPTIFGTPFELTEEEILSSLEEVSSPGMLLMTHAPAFMTNDEITSGLNVGSRSLAKIVEKYRPVVHLSGHVHEARAVVEKDGTLYMNPGAAKDGFSGLLVMGEDGPEATLL